MTSFHHTFSYLLTPLSRAPGRLHKWIVVRAAANKHWQEVPLSCLELELFRDILCYDITGSHGRCMFSCPRNPYANFHCSCISRSSPQHWVRAPFCLHPHQFFWLMIAMLTGVRCNFSVLWMCISLMVRDLDLFHMLIGLPRTSHLRVLLMSQPFVICLVVWFSRCVLSSLYILAMTPRLEVELVKTSHPSLGCLLMLAMQELFELFEVRFVKVSIIPEQLQSCPECPCGCLLGVFVMWYLFSKF